MAKFSLRRYDTQARVGMAISLLAVLPLAFLAFCILQRMDWTQGSFWYGSLRRWAILLSGAATIGMSAIGFGLGLNSVGQRRNDQSRKSWIGFFVGAGIFCLAILLLAVFKLRGDAILT